MRTPSFCLIAVSLTLSGCEWLHRQKPDVPPPPPNAQFGPPTAADLVTYLNKQADRIGVIESSDVTLVAHVQKTRLPGLVGMMVCEKPRKFRLTGEAIATPYLDIGSDGDQFWFWVKDGEAPLYHCSYVDYDRGAARLPLPFQPEWVVQALGMARYDPAKQYRVEQKQGTFELVENTTVQGMPVRKITVFNVNRSNDPSRPQVASHRIETQQGKIICQATIKRVHFAPSGTSDSIAYPSEVQLEWPAEQMSMTLKIGKATVNRKLTNEEASRYFSLPNYPGRQSIDLARMPPPGNPTSRDVRQAGGYQYQTQTGTYR